MIVSPYCFCHKADQFCRTIELSRLVRKSVPAKEPLFEFMVLRQIAFYFYKENPYATVSDLLKELSINNKEEDK